MKDKCYLMLTQAGKAVADNGRKSVKFSIHDARSLTNIRIVSVYCALSKLQILIFITRIGNSLINSLYGATETFASWFEMAFKRCVLGVTFHVNGLDLTYANIWQTSLTDVYIKQWLRRFHKERF